MIIIADENIPGAEAAFGPLGRLRLIAGRSMTAEAVREASILIVRSVTRVNHSLLAGSAVRFVGTATIGVDHVDQAAVAAQGATFASAPGCNAESVAQTVAAMLLALHRRGFPLAGERIGVIGAGHCGTRVERVAGALGMIPVVCDPPRARREGDARFRPLAEVAESCRFLTLHVPLVREGPDATLNLVNAPLLERMPAGAAILNCSRGDAVDESALLAALRSGRVGAAALDVWRDEPRVNLELVRAAALASPHVAGYSIEGKLEGTAMIHRALCAHLGIEPFWSPPAAPPERIEWDAGPGNELESAAALVERVHPLLRDAAAMRKMAGPPAAGDPAAEFDSLRREYPVRREFSAFEVVLPPGHPTLASLLTGLGFRVAAR